MNIYSKIINWLKGLEGKLIWFYVKIEQENLDRWWKGHELTNFTWNWDEILHEVY